MVQKKSADSEEARQELQTQTPLLLRREHIAHRTDPTCPPSLWIALTHNQLTVPETPGRFRPAAGYLPQWAPVSFF